MNPQRWKQIDDLLDAALDLEPARRSQFLDEACNGDQALRQKIERLLASDKHAVSFIEAPVLDPKGKFVVQEDTTTPETNSLPLLFSSEEKDSIVLRPGSMVAGRYQILSKLGKGGMGEVWRAFDVKLRVDVALKTRRLQFTTNEDPLEFLRHEVRIAREVISPNVCRIFDLISDEQFELISMEHIDGITLMEVIEQKRPLKLRDAIDIAAQFLAGLDAIHAAGLVHRDLKPENIMVTRTGRVVVMDLGIAQTQTQAGGSISGTLPYMSPEQRAGEEVDARSDIYSAGVVLAEMIHTKGTESDRTRERIWQAIREDPMQLPDSAWKEVIMRAVAERKEDRFDSARALAHALEEITVRTETIEDQIPYPGLASFSSSDSEFFFGREQEIETLIKKIQQLHLMALIGPSGAGKTSFVQAGLISALPKEWGVVLFHPAGAPMTNLQQRTAPMLIADEEANERIQRFEETDTAIWVLSRLRQAHAEFVLLVDRFEELFTLSSREVQSRFIEFLARATLEADVRILLVMRDDFFVFCNEHPGLSPIFSDVTPMLPLTASALRRALVQPALKCGYRFEDENLVHDILSDVEKERGALPLLAFAASLLWEKRDRAKGQLTRKAYREIGEVRGALAQHAENTMQRIGLEKEQIVHEIFRNLITAQNTRVARDIDDLMSVFDANRQDVKEILRVLVGSRLLTSFENRIEITHESLISNWPRLLKWRSQDADSAQMRDELRQAAHLWNQKGRPKELLWTGTAFLEFQLWRERYPGGLTNIENAFADAMTKYAYNKRKQQRILVSTIIVVLISIAIFIGTLWHKARIEADLSEASKLLVIGRSLPESDTKTKLAYAIASLQTKETMPARLFATQVLSGYRPPFVLVRKGTPSILFSPDDRWFAALISGELKLFPQDGSQPVFVTNDSGIRFQFTKDSRSLVWISQQDQRKIQVWSIDQKKIVRTYTFPGISKLIVQRSKEIYIATDTTGKKMDPVFRWDEIDLRVLNSATGDLKTLGHFASTVFGDFSNEGQSILFKATSNDYYLQNVLEPGKSAEKLPISGNLYFIRIDPTGKFYAASDDQGFTRIYSVHPPSDKPIRVLPATGELYFDPTGRYLAVARDKLTLFDLTSNEAAPTVIQTPPGEELNRIAFDHQGRWMAVAWNNSIEFYPLKNSHPFVFTETTGVSNNIRFTPDGKSVVAEFANVGLVGWSVPGEVQKPKRTIWSYSAPIGLGPVFDLDPSGKFAIVTGGIGEGQPYLISMQDGKSRSLGNKLPLRTNHSFSFSADGKFVAGVNLFTEQPTEVLGIEIWNLQTGEEKILDASKGIGSYAVKYAPDGSLFSGDTSGNLHHWNLNNHSHQIWNIGQGIVTSIAISKDGSRVGAVALSAKKWDDMPAATSQFAVLDLKTNQLERIYSHGNRLFCVTFDPEGTKLVTGDMDGLIRVGAIGGEVPHQLFGHQSNIADVAVDPTGRWIASTELTRPVVRLWPMPQGPSLESLSRDELLNRLYKLINVRVVSDKNSSTGYRLDLAPFPGWR